jgi:EmrB/QacA subfamily drug resistance transporter
VPTTAPDTARRGVLMVLPGLIIAMLLAQLDNLVVGTAMPRIVGELGGVEHLSWVVTAYTLATTISTPLYGKLGDLYGRKNLFVFAIAVFLLGSVLSGLSQSMAELIAFRAVQGLGAGGLIVGVMAIIGDLVPPRERGRYQGYFVAVMSLAMIGGPLLGGVLTDHLSWRWTFYINLPLGIVALVLVVTTLHLPKRTTQHRIDYLGAALLSAGITAAVLVTTWGGTQYAWGSPTIITLAVGGAVALAAFLIVESRAAEPVLPLRLFRDLNFSATSGIAFLSGFALFGAITFLPLFLQIAQGASATNSGALLIPLMLGAMVTSLAAGQIVTRTGRYRALPIIGGAAMTLGMFGFSMLDEGTSRPASSAYMIVLGAGLGLLMQVTTLLAQNSVEPKDMGVASSTSMFFRTIGGSFGVSLFGAIFNSRLQDSLRAAGTGLGSAAGGGRLDPGTLGQLPAAARTAVVHAVSHATQGVFLYAACVSALAFVLAWAIRTVPLRGRPTGTAVAAQAEQAAA